MPMKIDQGSLPAGEPGFARKDGLSNGSPVSLTDTTEGGTTLFEILWVSPDDTTSVSTLAPSPSNDHVWAFMPTPGVYGPIRIRLTHTDFAGNVSVETRIFGIPRNAEDKIPPAPGERADPNASLLNATDPEIIAKCERNWKTDEWPDGNPFGWALSDLGGNAPIDLATPTSDGLMAGSDKAKLDGLPGPPSLHGIQHLPGGRDPIPIAGAFTNVNGTTTTAGLMGPADKGRLTSLWNAPPAHQASHVTGTDKIPVASITTNGLMAAGDKATLEQLKLGSAPSAHQETHVTGNDKIPIASVSTDGLMSKADRITLTNLASGAGAHAASHVTGADKIPVASTSSNGLMAIGDKNALEALKPHTDKLPLLFPEDDSYILLADGASFAFPDIATKPRGRLLAQQPTSGGKTLAIEPPTSHTILVEVGEKLVPDQTANSYTLYEYAKPVSGLIVMTKRKLVKYRPPLPLPALFATHGNALWSVSTLMHNEYTGPLFRVRRASDDAEMDIGIDALGMADEVALASFCGSSQGFVSKLYDQAQLKAPAKHDLSQSLPQSQPLIYTGTAPVKQAANLAMKFDGVDDFLSGDHSCGLVNNPAVTTNAVHGSIYIVWRPAPKADVPAATPIQVRTALCIGGAFKAWGLGYNSDRLYNAIVGKGYVSYQTLANDVYTFVSLNVPELILNTQNMYWPLQGVPGSDFNAPHLSPVANGGAGEDLDVSSVQLTTMGKATVPRNDLPAMFSYGHFLGYVSHGMVFDQYSSSTMLNVYEIEAWLKTQIA